MPGASSFLPGFVVLLFALGCGSADPGRSTPTPEAIAATSAATAVTPTSLGATTPPGAPTAVASVDDALVQTIVAAAHPLTGDARDHDPLLELVGDARLVLIGEASHGTHEFYRERAEITRRLIEEKGFDAVALEANWPDADRVERYVRGLSDEDRSAAEALEDFRHFPTWMWRNQDVRGFVEWLADHNRRTERPEDRVGYYGLDLYSLPESIEAVVGYLKKVDGGAARQVGRHYACFDPYLTEPERYGLTTGPDGSCQDDALAGVRIVERLVDTPAPTPAVGQHRELAEDEAFSALQNARVVVGAEEFYRGLHQGGEPTWNIRDRHMATALDALMAHLDRDGRESKIVVWAHNTHVGDARATQMAGRGELNLGQLARERHGDDAVLVGFTTYTGTVQAASTWACPPELKDVRPAIPESYEALFHRVAEAGPDDFLLTLRGRDEPAAALRRGRLERAIGVLYLPETERYSHYLEARLPEQFDAVLHLDRTSGVIPLDPPSPEAEAGGDKTAASLCGR